MKGLLRAVLVFSVVLIARDASAQDKCASSFHLPATSTDGFVALHALQADGCLGESACTAPLCERFNTWARDANAQNAIEFLTDIRNSGAAAGNDQNLKNLVNRIDAWIAVIGKDEIAKLDPGQWRYDVGKGELFSDSPDAIKVDETLDVRCADGHAVCEATFVHMAEIVTDAALVRRVNGHLNAANRAALVKYVAGLDQRWTNYFNKTPSQFPWELEVNSLLYQKHERRGYNEPPQSQWIIAHPAASYEYTDKASDRFKPALSLEPLGYFRRNVGVSTLMSWSDRASGSKLGYGVAGHLQNKVMIGVVYHPSSDHKTSFVVSSQVEKFVAANSKKLRDALTKIH